MLQSARILGDFNQIYGFNQIKKPCKEAFILLPINTSIPVTVTERETTERFQYIDKIKAFRSFGSATATGVETTYETSISLETVRELTLQKPSHQLLRVASLFLSGSWKFGKEEYDVIISEIRWGEDICDIWNEAKQCSKKGTLLH